MFYAPSIPLQFDDSSGFKKMENIEDLVKFHLVNLLMTNPGERISLPNYGVGVRKFLFENFGSSLTSTLRTAIYSQVESYLSYLTIKDLVIVDNENNSITIKLSYSIESVQVEDVLILEIDPGTGDLLSNSIGANY